MAISKLSLITAFIALLAYAESGRSTHCGLWKGDSEFRCAKDGFRADTIAMHNIANNDVTFKIGKWLSDCGRPGNNYEDKPYFLASGGVHVEGFGEAGSGKCNEMFIYDCKIAGRGDNCLNALVVTPN